MVVHTMHAFHMFIILLSYNTVCILLLEELCGM